MSSSALEQVVLLASESVVPDLQDAVASLATADPATYQAMLGVLVQTASEPSILGLSNHLLYVGRKVAGS